MRTTFQPARWLLNAALVSAAASRGGAGIWIEQGDAPANMPGQNTGGVGPLTHIQGQLQSHSDVDVFCIQIVDPWAFMASTLGGAGFDTQLFLFEPGGLGITHNDDASAAESESRITGQFVPGPGVYAIAISAFNRDPVNAELLPIWQDAPFEIERPPDGPGAPGPLSSWIGAGTAWGNYQIELFGCEFWGPPCTPVVIVSQPQDQDIQVGEPFTLSAVAVGTPPITYQWYHGGQPIPGANGPNHSVGSAGPGDVGRYFVTATNPCGFDRSRRARVRVFRPGEPPPEPYCCYVPEVWQSADFFLSVDQNHDGLDDLFGDDFETGVMVLWDRCPDEPDIAAITSMSPQITVLHEFCTISVTALGGIDYALAAAIRQMDGVVAVQVSRVLEASLDTSVQAIRVAGGFYSPDTVNDEFPWLTGASVNIAIFDTGVDDPGGPGITHTSLPAAIFGYNSVPDVGVIGNPDDDHFHGTHVASIALGRGIPGAFALGRGGPATLAPGVAPGANLEDYKVLDADGMGEEWKVMRAVEVALRRDEADIFNFSLGNETRSDGNDAFSQLIDRCVELGVTVVAAAGNNYPGQVGWAPAAAARAITVAASDNMETPDRADDDIAFYSAAGPRLEESPPDPDLRDELKPEITAPGSVITGALLDTPDGTLTISGTSMATPHVAGVAALLIDAMPSINAGSVKQGILGTAEPRGGASWPARDPVWNDRWGFGYVDAYALLDLLYTCQPADLRFDTVTSSDPWDPWEAPAIAIDPDPPVVGEENRMIVNIYNAGPGDASDVLIEFGVLTFAGANPTYHHVATVPVASIPRYTWAVVETPWWPPQRGTQCLKVEIGYLCDGNFSNNIARRNIYETRSPAYFEARNFVFDAPTEITFVRMNDNPDWQLQITPPSVTMDLDDPPQTIEALPIPAFGTPAGTVERIRIGAYANGLLLGGVTIDAVMRDCNDNGYEDWFDIRDGRSTDLNANGIPDDCECWGDLDLDGVIGLADLSVLLTNFGLSGGMSYAQGDLDGDDDVDLADLSRLLEDYGVTCP